MNGDHNMQAEISEKEKSGNLLLKIEDALTNGKFSKIALVLLFAVLFAYGISNVKEYGRSWDELEAITITHSNWIEYAIRLFPDGSSVKENALAADITPISIKFERDHGAAPFYFFLPFYKMYEEDRAGMAYAWHTYVFCLYFMSVVASWFLLKELYGSKIVSTAGMLFYYFTPRFFAEGHYNDKDVIFMGLTMACALFAVRAAKKLSLKKKGVWADILIFSVLSGFMMNVKIIGIAIWGLLGLFTIIYVATRGKSVKLGTWMKIVLTVLLSVAMYIALTPASWAGILDFLKFLFDNAFHYSGWYGFVRFRGTLFNPAEIGMPYSYLPTWMLITIPAYIMILFSLSVLSFVITTVKERGKNIVKDDSDFFFLMLLIGFLAPFCLVVAKSHTEVFYNSWRHMYFLYAFMLPGALYFPHKLLSGLKKDDSVKRKRIAELAYALVTIAFLTCAGEMIANRSFEYVYYNPISRLIIDVNGYEGDYWMVSVVPALRRFADKYYDGEHPLKVACVLFESHGAEAAMLDENKIEFVAPEKADYLIYNPSGSYDWPEIEDHDKVFSINRFGVELTGIYAK